MRCAFFILVLIPSLSFAQFSEDQLDSLNGVVNNPSSPDTVKVLALLQVAYFYYLQFPDTALDICERANQLAEKVNYPYGKSESYSWLGYLVEQQGDLHLALEYYSKCLEIEEKLGNKKELANTLNNIGFIYEQQADIPKALEYHTRSLKIREELGNSPDSSTAIVGKQGIAQSLNNIGYIYKYQGDLAKAVEFFNRSFSIYEEMGNKPGIALGLNNMGIIYDEQGDTAKALEYYTKSLKIEEELGNKMGIANRLNNMGLLFSQQGNLARALDNYLRCLKIQEELGNKQGITLSLYNIGSIEFKQGELERAENYGRRGLEIAVEVGSPKHIRFNSGLLCEVAKKRGNYKEALEMYELHIQMRDSIKNEETQKATIRQQTKYEFEKAQLVKEQEEKEKARLAAEVTGRRDNLQYSVILIALLVLFGGVMSLGFVKVSARMAEGIIFFSFLILFEFLLVLADPYIDRWSGGAPGIKLLFNAGIAAMIFPLHSLFETKLKGRLVKQ